MPTGSVSDESPLLGPPPVSWCPHMAEGLREYPFYSAPISLLRAGQKKGPVSSGGHRNQQNLLLIGLYYYSLSREVRGSVAESIKSIS